MTDYRLFHKRTTRPGEFNHERLDSGEVAITDHDNKRFVYDLMNGVDPDEYAIWFANADESGPAVAVFRASEREYYCEYIEDFRIYCDDGESDRQSRRNACRENGWQFHGVCDYLEPSLRVDGPDAWGLSFSREDANDWPATVLEDAGLERCMFDSINSESVQTYFSAMLDSAIEEYDCLA